MQTGDCSVITAMLLESFCHCVDVVLGTGQLQMADDLSCDVKMVSRSGCRLTFISELLLSELIH